MREGSTVLRFTDCHRNQTSYMTSSASAALPSMRYAMPNRRGRTLAKTDRPSSCPDLRAGADGRRRGRVTCCHECTYLSVQRNLDRRFAKDNERVFRSLAFPLVVNPPSPDHRAFSTVLRAQFPVTKRWDVRSYQVRRTVMNCLGRNSNGTIEMGEPEQ